ncbi:iron-sulfur cluster biosynthesis family protein [Pediococcus argentinicus]|nr:iron-sulfur cluster biosynthesis family protein [Pediococcus argentinicus]NKZ22075.1 iron-sulfur cluster biosynthesis family protein [Pediococcus argentinicus]
MELKFDEAAIAKLQPMLSDDKKILLTFEDGVGPYSQHAMIHMQVQFSINLIGKDMPMDEYNQKIDSNLGDVWIKDYSADDLDEHMSLKFDQQQDTLRLSGNGGIIDTNVGLIDFTDPDGVKKNPAR